MSDKESAKDNIPKTKPRQKIFAAPNSGARASKKLKPVPLHDEHVAPLSFLREAAVYADSYQMNGAGNTFGLRGEAYVRQCYDDFCLIVNEALQEREKEVYATKRLFVVRGSSGVGKSTFLGYTIASLQQIGMKNIAIFHASKSAKTSSGVPVQDQVKCIIRVDGKVTEGNYANVRDDVDACLSELDVLIMDGCSMHFDLADFAGLVIMAASPSLYVKNVIDAIMNHTLLTMPPLDKDEAIAIHDCLCGVLQFSLSKEDMLDNFEHMNGITRYLFRMGSAKQKVDDSVQLVNANAIRKMVAMQSKNKAAENVAVHALVLWSVQKDEKGKMLYEAPPKFDLVSRYAESLVAKKLAEEATDTLSAALKEMAPMSGAEGYAGALFEAYAIRKLQSGGRFTLRRLGTTTEKVVNLVPISNKPPIVVQGNVLSEKLVPIKDVRVRSADEKEWIPCILWPTTTNFPTFDCFYFDSDGQIYCLQMTIAAKHDLKNSGASNAKKYMDIIYKTDKKNKPAKYQAVFVVREGDASSYQPQKFTGNVDNKVVDLGGSYEQWVLGV